MLSCLHSVTLATVVSMSPCWSWWKIFPDPATALSAIQCEVQVRVSEHENTLYVLRGVGASLSANKPCEAFRPNVHIVFLRNFGTAVFSHHCYFLWAHPRLELPDICCCVGVIWHVLRVSRVSHCTCNEWSETQSAITVVCTFAKQTMHTYHMCLLLDPRRIRAKLGIW